MSAFRAWLADRNRHAAGTVARAEAITTRREGTIMPTSPPSSPIAAACMAVADAEMAETAEIITTATLDTIVRLTQERDEALANLDDAEARIERLWAQLNEATNVPDDGPYIWIARGRQSGEPCIGGTRIPVATLTNYADALGEEAALAAYPTATASDIEEARWFQGHPHDDPRPDRCQAQSAVRLSRAQSAVPGRER